MRLTIQHACNSWDNKFIVDSIGITAIPSVGTTIVYDNKSYLVHQVTIDYDNNEWVHILVLNK